MKYFEDLLTYWKSNLGHLVPADRLYLGRNIQDPPYSLYAVVLPLASSEPEESTGGDFVETIPFELHVHGPTDEVVTIGATLWRHAPVGLAWAPINAQTLGLLRKSKRYVREATDLHHFLMAWDWMVEA